MVAKESLYGADAKEWLARWDSGQPVHSIEMSGLGPSYEQVIQIFAAEILRMLINSKYDNEILPVKQRGIFESKLLKNKNLNKLGASGAQVGAAFSLAFNIYTMGPIKIMDDPKVKDRHIMVSKNFPSLEA